MKKSTRTRVLLLAVSVAGGVLSSKASVAATDVWVERLEDSSISIRYAFDEEVTELGLPAATAAIRAKYWTVADGQFVIAADKVVAAAGSAFRTVTLRVKSSDDFMERQASSLAPWGPTSASMGPTSSVIDLSQVRPERPAGDATIHVRNAWDPSAGGCVGSYDVPASSGAASEMPLRRFVVVSTTLKACTALRDPDVAVILSESVAPELKALIANELAGATRRLEASLGAVGAPRPVFVLVHNPQASRNSSSVLAGDSLFVALFEGKTWLAPTPTSTDRLATTLTQSLVLSWLRAPPPAELSPLSRSKRAWFDSGAAGYLAAVDHISQGRGSSARPDTASRLLADVGLCGRTSAQTLPGADSGAPVEYGQGCGLLVQLVYDAITRSESANQRTIYDLWADALRATDVDRPVDVELFLATNPRAKAALSGLIYGPAADLGAIAVALRVAGIDARVEPTHDVGWAVGQLLMPFMRIDCDGTPAGFGPRGDRIVFQTKGQCRTVPKDFSLIAIEGQAILADMSAVYKRVGDACAQRGVIRATAATAQGDFSLKCPDDIPDVPEELTIRDVGFLRN